MAAVAVAFLAYSLLSHYANSHAQVRELATVLALAPIFCIAGVLIWRWQGLIAGLLSGAIAAAAAWLAWPHLTENFTLLYLVQQCGFHLLMAGTFAATLLQGRVPLCTLLADKVHGPLGPEELRYTRQVTAAWALFFVLNFLITVLLYEFASLHTWSLFVNFVSLPLIGLMFACEYAVRRRVLPKVESGGLMATLRVYFVNPP